MNSITDASETNHYLITVKPGIYNETVTMTSYVDVVGSGEGVTVITSAVTFAVGNSLKNLTVDGGVSMNAGGDMDQVTVLSSGTGVTVGVNYEATIVDSTISASFIGAVVRGHLTLESSAVYGDTAIQMAALAPASLLMRNSTASGVSKGLEMTNMSGDAAIYDSVLAGPNALQNNGGTYGYTTHALSSARRSTVRTPFRRTRTR
jgi:pectin methylesterase-like acyl-CoA thioesterase